ncbi:MAG: hypothetical protein HOW73_27435 [Polyangiaceae bacterium]|nr:hypothetical protein [Polyangiaceae bacterium]
MILAGCEGAPLWAPLGGSAQSTGGSACEEAADILESCPGFDETVQCGDPTADEVWGCILDGGVDLCDFAAGTLSDADLEIVIECSDAADG